MRFLAVTRHLPDNSSRDVFIYPYLAVHQGRVLVVEVFMEPIVRGRDDRPDDTTVISEQERAKGREDCSDVVDRGNLVVVQDLVMGSLSVDRHLGVLPSGNRW